MSLSKIETSVLDMHKTITSLVKRIESLENVVRDQSMTIKSQSDLLAKLTQVTTDVNISTPTRNVTSILAPIATSKQRPPTRAATTRAISAITEAGRKKRDVKSVSPLSITPANTASASKLAVPVASTSSSVSVTPPLTDVNETNEITVNINDDNNKWVKVQHKRSRNVKNVIKGTAAPGSTTLEASEPWKYYHLYYVKAGTTDEMIRGHLSSICKHDSCTVESLKPKGNYASFKLGIPAKLSELVLGADNWAQEICIKPWRNLFRNQTN